MALFTLERIILVAVVLMRLAAAEEAENPTIQTCTSPSSVGAPEDVTKYTCSDDPTYTVGTPATAGASTPIQYNAGEFQVTSFETELSLSSTTDCGVSLMGSLTCTDLVITIGSKAGGNDGSGVQIGGNGADGLAQWTCEDETPLSPITMSYYFPISFTATAEMATGSVAVMASIYSSGGSAPATANFDPMAFAKFSEVDKDTEIYLLKENDQQYHTFFLSAETTIMFKAEQYATITGSADNTALAKQAASPCDNAVRLCFEDGCDGAVTVSSLGILLLLIPFIVAVFN